MPSPRYIIRESKFIGYNDRDPPEQLKPRYLADALNCFLKTGEIVKRTGYSLIGNDIELDKPCQGLFGAKFSDGTKELIGVFNGSIYKWTGSGNWALITSGSGVLSTTAQIDIVMANNAVYFFDGTSTVPKYNGTAISTVAAIPKGKYAKWFHNQLHVANISTNKNRLQSSVLGDPETFTGGASSDLDVNPNDGDEITGLQTLKDELFVFKERRVWAATNFGTAALTLSSVEERATGLGTLSNRSIVNTGNELFYISFSGNIPHFRSIMRTLYGVIVDNGIISQDIEGTMNGLNKAKLENTAGFFDGRYVWFALTNGASTTNNLVLTYDTITKGWSRHTGINASVIIDFSVTTTPQVYFGEATDVSKAYVFDSSTDDNGTAINFQVISRRYGGDEPEHKNKYKWLYVRSEETGNYDVTVDYAKDGFSYDNLGTINLSGTGSVFDNIILDTSRLGSTDLSRDRFTFPKNRSYYLQFKLYDTSATSSITIRDWELIFMKKLPISDK